MATTTIEPRRVCFSFAAYAKNLIHHLKNSDVPLAQGLTNAEFSAIAATYHFKFPPDLRSILQEGLPVGTGFPNWRSSSPQRLQTLINLPILGILQEVSGHNFWLQSWGDRPEHPDEALNLAERFLNKAPVLVPVYRHCYIPSMPYLAGNPVFYVRRGNVKLWSFDLVGFFQQVEFRRNEAFLRRQSLSILLNAPAWAATEARRVQFWTELVERAAERGGMRGWWSGEVGGCLDEVCWRLRDGGWREEEVREMMMMDGGDHGGEKRSDERGVMWHVRVLSLRLLRAGWTKEDVMESLGFQEDGVLEDVMESLRLNCLLFVFQIKKSIYHQNAIHPRNHYQIVISRI